MPRLVPSAPMLYRVQVILFPRPLSPASRLASLLLASIAGLVLLACGGESPTSEPASTPSPEPTATATPRPAPSIRRPDANPFPPELRAVGEEIYGKIAAVRGTTVREPVEMFLLNRDQARAYYLPERPTPSASQPRPPAQRPLDAKTELYRLLCLVPPAPPSQDNEPPPSVAQQSIDDLLPLITGFYSAELNAYYMLEEIRGGVTGPSAIATMVHELTHALQDQYFDLTQLAHQRAADWDGTRALNSVIEGEAVASENAYLGYSLRASYRVPVCFAIPQAIRPGSPFVIERELDTWYEDGLCFINAVKGRLPNGVAGIWERLPTTTEQILHPDKYLANEGAAPVTLQPLLPALGDGWQRVDGSSFGEFSLQNLLLLGLEGDRPLVQRAAAGWGGDAWALYAREGQRLAHYEIAWDLIREAEEFWAVLQQSLRRRGNVSTPAPNSIEATIGGSFWRAQLKGDRVTLLVANAQPLLDTAAQPLGLP